MSHGESVRALPGWASFLEKIENMKNEQKPTASEPLETRPASSLEIPQIDVIFPFPRAWFDFIKLHELNVGRKIENWTTGGTGRIFISINERLVELCDIYEARCGLEITRAKNTQDFVQAVITIRRDVWEMFELAASNVGKTCLEMLFLLCAEAISFEKSDGPETRSLLKNITERAKRDQAFKPVPIGKVITGPWNESYHGCKQPLTRRKSRSRLIPIDGNTSSEPLSLLASLPPIGVLPPSVIGRLSC